MMTDEDTDLENSNDAAYNRPTPPPSAEPPSTESPNVEPAPTEPLGAEATQNQPENTQPSSQAPTEPAPEPSDIIVPPVDSTNPAALAAEAPVAGEGGVPDAPEASGDPSSNLPELPVQVSY